MLIDQGGWLRSPIPRPRRIEISHLVKPPLKHDCWSIFESNQLNLGPNLALATAYKRRGTIEISE
ncbi:hypothetical protein QJS04_geneDACA014916 [Acorus gramineus]|uniref:Uncharacterized protein n=1 Tax=Acorus gramineus TaxID=55184 RepID=A0AAV9BXI5_ACOGR|nr:hypothetical protein QJS04_geneDACA014916 [Acorus gramineus]